MPKKQQFVPKSNDLEKEVSNVVDEGSSSSAGDVVNTSPVDASKIQKKKVSFIKKIAPTVDSTVNTEQLGAGSNVDGGTGVSAMAAGLKSLSYGGTDGTVLGSAAGTPGGDNTRRSANRSGQKLDEVTRRVDSIVSEQVVEEYSIPDPLEKNPDEPMGYLGQPINANARSQKASGGVPADLMYQRSLDLLKRDEIVWERGQYIPNEEGARIPFPTETLDSDFEDSIPFRVREGNFLNSSMTAMFSDEGRLLAVRYASQEVPIVVDDAQTENDASSTALREMNRIELDRQVIQNVAGNPKSEKYSPLALGVQNPVATNEVLRVYEETSGSIAYMATRFAGKALAYQVNKASKDGQKDVRARNEALFGNAVNVSASSAFTPQGLEIGGVTYNPFSPIAYAHGAPSLAIAMDDTVTKYRTRGDLLNLPRSWKMHYSKLLTKSGVFNVRNTLPKVVAARDVFSTIDREYDPLKPVCVSESFGLISPISYSDVGDYSVIDYAIFKIAQSGVNAATIASRFPEGLRSSVITYTDSKGGTWDDVRSYDFIRLTNEGSISFSTDLAALNAINEAVLDHENASRAFMAIATDNLNAIYIAIPIIHGLDAQASLGITSGVSTTVFKGEFDSLCAVQNYEAYATPYRYCYFNDNIRYTVTVHHPMMYGIVEGLKSHSGLQQAVRGNANTRYPHPGLDLPFIRVPITYTSTTISMWPYIVSLGITYAQKERANSMIDVLTYVENHGTYPYSDFTPLKLVDINASSNYRFKTVTDPLESLRMDASVAYTWKHPEIFWTVSGVVRGRRTVVLPQYMCSQSYPLTVSRMLTKSDQSPYMMNFPCVRDGLTLEAIRDEYDSGLSMRQIRLIQDQMVAIPQVTQDALHSGYYKYGAIASGIPLLTMQSDITIGSFLGTPRELGLFCVAPGNLLSPAVNQGSSFDSIADWWVMSMVHDSALVSTSYQAVVYFNDRATDPEPELFCRGGTVISKAANFAQQWRSQQAGDYLVYGSDENGVALSNGNFLRVEPAIGILLSPVDAGATTATAGLAFRDGDGLFSPFVQNVANNNIDDRYSPTCLISLQKYMYNRLHKLPFVISPFDASCREEIGDNELFVPSMDIYDLAYWFNFCGFLPCDYEEDVNDRLQHVIDKDWLYVDEYFFSGVPFLA